MEYIVTFKIPIYVSDAKNLQDAVNIAGEMCLSVHGFRPTMCFGEIQEKHENGSTYKYLYNGVQGSYKELD